jgi:hypothetical protein
MLLLRVWIAVDGVAVSNRCVNVDSTKSSTHLQSAMIFRIWNTILASLVMFNIALVISSPTALLSNWLLPQFIDSQALLEMSQLMSVLTQFGLDIFLPAAILATSFYLLGFRIQTPPKVWQQCYLASFTVAYFVFWMAMRENQLYGWYLIGGAPFIIVWLIGGAVLVLSETTQHWVRPEAASHSIRKSLAVGLFPFSAPLLVSVLLLTQASSQFTATKLRKTSFLEQCQTVGMKIVSKPSGLIRSIAFDRSKGQGIGYSRVEFDSHGKPVSFGGFGVDLSPLEAAKKLDVDYYEIRTHKPNGEALEDGHVAYFLTKGFAAPVEVKGLSPDAVVRYAADKPEELLRAPIYQHAVKYSLTLVETRSGNLLGEYSYVIDQINGRGCGANVGNAISEDAFLYTVLKN